MHKKLISDLVISKRIEGSRLIAFKIGTADEEVTLVIFQHQGLYTMNQPKST